MGYGYQFTVKRIGEIGIYLAEFAWEFIPPDADVKSYDDDDIILLFDVWYLNFIRYARTNGLINPEEVIALDKNLNDLDGLIKTTALETVKGFRQTSGPLREIENKKPPVIH